MFRYLLGIFLSYTAWGQGYVIQTIAGSNATGDGNPAVYSSLGQAEGVIADGAGNVYVSDAADHRVRRIGRDGIITTVAGTGFPGFRGDSGPAADSQLNSPYGLALDRGGSLYIADLGNARVRKITPDGRILTVAGGGTLPLNRKSEGSQATDIALKAPRNLAFDSAGALYISDFGANMVVRVAPDGNTTIAVGNGGSLLTYDGPASNANIGAPAGLAFDSSGVLYIAESQNGRIRKLSAGYLSTAYLSLAGMPQLNTPTGLAIDSSGAIYVSDGFGGQIIKMNKSGTVSQISISARDLCVDSAGNVLAARGQFVWRFNTNGTATLVAGDGKYGFAGDGSAADAARLYHPAAIATDAQGNLYIADEANNRVRMVSPTGKLTTIAGHASGGYLGDGGPAVEATLNNPGGVAVDTYGLVYIADTGANRIRRISPEGTITTFAGTGNGGFYGDGVSARNASIDHPTAIMVDRNGYVYIADTNNNRIRRISPDGNITTVAGSTSVPGFGGDNALAIYAQLSKPTGLAQDRAGNIYIADTGNGRIRRLDKLSGIITSLPIVDLTSPRGIAFEADDSLLIADTANQRIRRWKADGTISTIAGTGRAEFEGDGGNALQASFFNPYAVLPNADGTILIADYLNNRVRKLTPSAVQPAAVTFPTATIVNAASFVEGPVAPGELVSILGGPFSTQDPITGNATILGDIQVRFDGLEAALTYVSPKQINAIVPDAIAYKTTVTIEIYQKGVLLTSKVVGYSLSSLGVYTINGGSGQAAAYNADGSANSAANPVNRGDIVTIFVNGLGIQKPSVFYAGYESELQYVGGGQINFRVPAGFVPTGIQPVIVRVGSVESQPGVTIAVR